MKKNNVFIISFLLFFSITQKPKAQGNLMIIPKRIVFEGQKKTHEISLANTGTDTARYLISIIQMRMKEDGSFEKITEPDSGQYFAKDYVRYFPRNVVLPPDETQVIKVQLTKADKLLPGEYRSHIYFRADQQNKPAEDSTALPDTTAITIKLKAIFGITIPLIIRKGESDAKAAVSELSLSTVNDTACILNMRLLRSGNMSVYGDITVFYVPVTGKEIQVGIAKGVAVYTPNKSRLMQIKLDNNNIFIDFKKGYLRVVYSEQNGKKFDEKMLSLE